MRTLLHSITESDCLAVAIYFIGLPLLFIGIIALAQYIGFLTGDNIENILTAGFLIYFIWAIAKQIKK